MSIKTATEENVKNAGIIYSRDVSTQEVKKIATYADFQVGLSNLPRNLIITGDLTSPAVTFNLLNEEVTRTINIATGAAAQTVVLGSATDTSSLTLNAGTGTIGIGTSASVRTTNIATGLAAQTVTLGSATGTSSLTLNAGTGNINIGTAQLARTITIGPVSTGSASAIIHTINVGFIPSNGSAITNVNIGTAGVGSTKNVIKIGNFGSTIASSTAIFCDEIGFFSTSPIAKKTGVAVTAAAIHAALVAYGLISA